MKFIARTEDELHSILTAMLNQISGTTMATVTYTTEQPVSAANRKAGVRISKQTVASVTLAGKLNPDTNVYENAVKRTAEKQDNDPADVAAFQAGPAYFEHTPGAYSLVTHKTNGTRYLQLIYNRAGSQFQRDGKYLTREEVAEYCTPSVADKLLNGDKTVENKSQNVTHTVHAHTVKLRNFNRIAIDGNEILLQI